MISLKDVHKSIGGRKILAGVTLEVPAGGVTCLVGRSGAGKSVLSRCAVGLFRIDSGSICIGGAEVSRLSEAALDRLRCRVPYVVQGSALIDWMSVRSNLEVPLLRALRLSAGQARARANRALEDVGLTDRAGHLPGALSAGDRKLAAIARALALEPEAIFYDEPTTGLDPEAARRVDRLILERSRQGTTSIVVSHDLNSIQSIATRVALLDGGKISWFGETHAFFAAKDSDPAIHRFFHLGGT